MAISPVSKTQPMREGEIAAIDALNTAINQLNKANKTLWTGNWNNGDITVNELSNYSLFAVSLSDESAICLVYSPPNSSTFIGGTFDINTTPNVFALACRALRSGNTLTYRNAGYINVAGTSIISRSITKIVGII